MPLYASRSIVLGVIGKGELIAVGGYGSYSVNCGKKIACYIILSLLHWVKHNVVVLSNDI